MAKDVVFPTRALKRQLDDAQKKLKEMEDELYAIRCREEEERKRKKRARVRTLTEVVIIN